MMDDVRARAYSTARAAVRAYSMDPNVSNAAEVEEAWRLIRTLNAVSAWQAKPLPDVDRAVKD
jgi:hypothetical protein